MPEFPVSLWWWKLSLLTWKHFNFQYAAKVCLLPISKPISTKLPKWGDLTSSGSKGDSSDYHWRLYPSSVDIKEPCSLPFYMSHQVSKVSIACKKFEWMYSWYLTKKPLIKRTMQYKHQNSNSHIVVMLRPCQVRETASNRKEKPL